MRKVDLEKKRDREEGGEHDFSVKIGVWMTIEVWGCQKGRYFGRKIGVFC